MCLQIEAVSKRKVAVFWHILEHRRQVVNLETQWKNAQDQRLAIKGLNFLLLKLETH